jgi:hypothetical protein
VHSLTGNARFQIGNGLPIPIGFTAPPNGKVAARAGATIRQHGGNGKLVLDPSTPGGLPGQLFFDGAPMNLPVHGFNQNVFQVQTNVLLQFPRETVSFDASGRTGADTLTWCPGSVVTANGNPMCASPDAGVIHGRITYTRTAGQFGGPASGFIGGSANMAVRPPGAAVAPCAFNGGANPLCIVAFALATPATEGAVGNAFGFVNSTAGAAPNPGAFNATIAANGEILNIVNPGTGLGLGISNPVTEFGAPWTAGSVRISVTENLGPVAEIFTLMGNDSRTANGQGTISFVAGSVSARTFTGPNANRGWLNLTIGPAISEAPVMPLQAVGALIGLLALSGGYVLRRRSQAAGGRAR